MKFKQMTIEGCALLVLACLVGLGFNAQRSAGLVLTRNYFPVLTEPQGGDERGKPIPPKDEGPTHSFNVVSLAEALEYYNRGESSIVFIDARDDANYDRCHIPTAVQFDYYRPDDYIDNVRDFVTDAEIVIIYCNGGECEDSIQAARYLTEEIDDPLMFDVVHVFEGGIQAWYQAGYDREPENCQP